MIKMYRGSLREQPLVIDLYGYRGRMAQVKTTSNGFDVWVERDGRFDDELGNWLWFGEYDTAREALREASHVLRKIGWFEQGRPRKWN